MHYVVRPQAISRRSISTLPVMVQAPHQSHHLRSATEERTVPSSTFEMPQTASWRHVQWVLPTFIGTMAMLSAVALTYLRPKPVAMVATSGDMSEEGNPMGRRQAVIEATGAAGLAFAFPVWAASQRDADQAYRAETLELLAKMKPVLALQKGDPEMPAQVEALRDAMSEWLAKYRRDDRFEGKASYGNTYAAINALAGHYTSVGNSIPLPAKRLEKVLQSIAMAEQLIPKGR